MPVSRSFLMGKRLGQLTLGLADNGTVTSGSALATSVSDVAGGGLVQMVHFELGNRWTTTSTSYAASDLTASITPTSASNKIVILISAQFGHGSGAVSNNFQVWRNSSFFAPAAGTQTVSNRSRAWNTYNNGDNNISRVNSLTIVDSTYNSTSQQTYTVYTKVQNGGNTVTLNGSYSEADNFNYGHIGSSYITLMEVSV